MVIHLPAPDSPTTPKISPGTELQRDVFHRHGRPVLRGKMDGELAHLETRLRGCGVLVRGGLSSDDLRGGCGLHHPSILGLSVSRSQSPSRLIAKARMIRVRPGKIVIHHSPEKR